MPSKRELIAELTEKVSKLDARIAELEARATIANTPIPFLPNTIINYWNSVYCTNCGQYYNLNIIHICLKPFNQYWDPNGPVKVYSSGSITVDSATGTITACSNGSEPGQKPGD